jgi:serine/threonine-protein phosphatase 2A regulatory subunit A
MYNTAAPMRLTTTQQQLLPLVVELGHDNIWRVRRAVMASVPLLAERMGVQYFEDYLLEMYMQVKIVQ